MQDEAKDDAPVGRAEQIVIVGRANDRRTVVFLCINLVLVAVCVAQLAFGAAQPTTVGLLVLAVLAALLQFSLLRHPWQMTVADGNFSIHRRRHPQFCPIQDVVCLEYDAGMVRLTFRNLVHIESKRLRSRLEKQFSRHGDHLNLAGAFSLAQINQVRGALEMEPVPEIRPGSLAEFNAEFRALTPLAFVTAILVVVNVVMFAAMALSCESHLRPTAMELVRWGGSFGPLTNGGQAWRLLTAMFLHVGLLHLFVNMLVLAMIGPLVERLFGNLRFAIIYIVGGLWGSVISVWSHPLVVAVGASGAIFGLYGALGAFFLQRSLPPRVIRRYRGVTIGFVIFNLIVGLSDKQVDLAAHIGGLAAGFALGLALGHQSHSSAANSRWRRTLIVTLAGAASVALAVSFLKAPVDKFTEEIQLFRDTDRAVLARTYDAEAKHEGRSLSDGDFIAVLKAEGIDRWGPALDRIAKLKNVPESRRDYWSQIVRYAELRRDGWQLMIEGIQKSNEQLIDDAHAKQQAADAIATELTVRQTSDWRHGD